MRDIIVLRDVTTAEELSAIDLREEAEAATEQGRAWDATRLLIDGQAAEILTVEDRVGLSWGSDAVWGDAITVESISATVCRLLGEEAAS